MQHDTLKTAATADSRNDSTVEDIPDVQLLSALSANNGIDLPCVGEVHTTVGPDTAGFVLLGRDKWLQVLAVPVGRAALAPGIKVLVKQAPSRRQPRSIDNLLAPLE